MRSALPASAKLSSAGKNQTPSASAAREAIRDEDLIHEATVEHQSAKDLIAQIEASDPSDELFDAKVKVLGEYVKHHVKEEQNELFPQVRKTKLDLKELGERLMTRKQQLMAAG